MANTGFLCSSAVIDHLQDKARENKYGVAYIYFDYKEQNQQKPLQVLASLVKQLATQAPQLPTEIIDLHKKLTKENKRPTQQELYPALVSILKSFSQGFFVFDALDECDQNRQRKELLPLFHRMVQENSTVSILLTSRQYPEDIQVSFSNSAKIELRANDEDIKNYIQQKIDENPRAKRLVKGELKDKIISELTKCANGMFLLVHFHIELICQQTTPRKITKELERLKHESSAIGNNRSTTENSPLDPTYDRAVKSIRTQARSCVELATKIFTWLVKAQRPLTVDELRMAVSIEPNLYELDDEDLPDKATLLDVCAGLVTIDEKSSTVRLAHYTVQEYLLKSSLIPEDANAELAIACVTFLSFDIFTQGACKSDEFLESRIKAHPFLKYAVFQLPSHLKCCDEILSTESLLKFLENPGSVACYSQIVYCIDKIHGDVKESYWDYCYPCFPKQFPLHVASAVGHHAALQALLSKGADISARCSDLETALHVAARHGHEAVVMLLLENSADITVTNKLQYTALHLAAENSHDAVTRLLLEKGADISARCHMQETALHKATIHGHEAVVRLLLDNGADITLTNKSGLTVLQLAAGKGHCSVARLLLENGADISARCHMQETALHKATIHGHEAVVRLLLENGADVTQKNIFDYTALHCASEHGHYAVARLLLENGADISAKTEWGETPLLKAVGSGRKAIIQLLIDRGSDLFERSGTGVTPFEYAVWGQREDIAQLIQPTIVSYASM